MNDMASDRDRMEAFLRDVETPLYSYVCRLVRNRANADDVYQEAVARVQHLANGGRLRDSGQETRALLFTIAHQLATDQHRLRRWTVEREGDAEIRPDRPLDQLLVRQQLDMALDELPEGQRQALLLRVYGELAYTDIAHALNASEVDVKTCICGARIRLTELLDADGQYIGGHAEKNAPDDRA
jgi:RNA polymerase sigma-70 factor (ECF subfamily)